MDVQTVYTLIDKAEWIYETDPKLNITFKMKRLYLDPKTQMEILYCEYPKGYVKPLHHHTFGQGLYVLEGEMAADDKILHKGDFVWYPAGAKGTHGATDAGDAKFIAISDGGSGVIYD